MSLTAQQDDLLQLIKKKIKNLRNLVYGHGLNEQEVLTILRNIMIRCCPKNYTDCFSKDKSFINIIQKLINRRKISQGLLVNILTQIDCELACFKEDHESSSDVVEVKRVKSSKKKTMDQITQKLIKLQEISCEQRDAKEARTKLQREEYLLRKKMKAQLMAKIRRKKREDQLEFIFRS